MIFWDGLGPPLFQVGLKEILFLLFFGLKYCFKKSRIFAKEVFFFNFPNFAMEVITFFFNKFSIVFFFHIKKKRRFIRSSLKNIEKNFLNKLYIFVTTHSLH